MIPASRNLSEMSCGSFRLRAADPVPHGGAKCMRQRLCCSCTIKSSKNWRSSSKVKSKIVMGPFARSVVLVHSYSSEVSFPNLHCQTGSSSKNFEEQHVLKQRWPFYCYMACACETAVRHFVLWSAMPGLHNFSLLLLHYCCREPV